MIKPFTKLEMHDFYRHDLEKIMMASRLASAIQRDEKDIRASGDEVEMAVRAFFKHKLAPKYHVSSGHVVDKEFNVSQQLDIVISDALKNPVFDSHADSSELLYYDSLYAYGEVKKTYYEKEILSHFSENVKRFKANMKREAVDSNVLECANDMLMVKQPLVDRDKRNLLFTFLFIVNSKGIDFDKIKEELNNTDNAFLPNMVIILDVGILVNVKQSTVEAGKHPVINLYPELATEDQEWKLLTFDDSTGVLTYSYLLLQEHLRNTVVKAPDFMDYTDYIFSTYKSSII